MSSSVSASPGKEKEGANTTGLEEGSSPSLPQWLLGMLYSWPPFVLPWFPSRSHHLAREMPPPNPDQRRIMGNLERAFCISADWLDQRDSALAGDPGSPDDPWASVVAILPRK